LYPIGLRVGFNKYLIFFAPFATLREQMPFWAKKAKSRDKRSRLP
jgi:hypothetical protein